MIINTHSVNGTIIVDSSMFFWHHVWYVNKIIDVNKNCKFLAHSQSKEKKKLED